MISWSASLDPEATWMSHFTAVLSRSGANITILYLVSTYVITMHHI